MADSILALVADPLLGDPPKVTITNLATGFELAAQFNPNALKERGKANFTRMKVQGAGFQRMHFENTDNYQIEFDLFFKAYTEQDLRVIHVWRRHLLSWVYPKRPIGNLVGSAPPELLVSWPGMISTVFFMTEVEADHVRFHSQMKSVGFTAKCKFEETRDEQITSEDVAEDWAISRFGEVDSAGS